MAIANSGQSAPYFQTQTLSKPTKPKPPESKIWKQKRKISLDAPCLNDSVREFEKNSRGDTEAQRVAGHTKQTPQIQATGEQNLEAKTENLLGRSVSQRLRERIRKNSRGDTEAQRVAGHTKQTPQIQATGEQNLEAKTENLLGRSVSQRLRERIRKNSRGDTEAQRAVR